MHCSDTDEHPAVQLQRMEHLNVATTSRLNRLIGMLKAGFRGEGRITITFSGGNADCINIEAVDQQNRVEYMRKQQDKRTA